MTNEYIHNPSFESLIKDFQYHKKNRNRCKMIIGDLNETLERKLRKNNDNSLQEKLDYYINNYNESCRLFKDYQGQLATIFYTLSANLVSYKKYYGVDPDDAIQECVLICLERVERFDQRKGKAFNYMTTCILNQYRHMYRCSKNHNELKKKFMLMLIDTIDSVIYKNGIDRKNMLSSLEKEEYNKYN